MELPVTFHQLYERHAAEVYRFALSLSGNAEEAEDVLAETFARCWADFERIRLPTVKAYLFTIARNLVYQGYRRKKRHAALDPELADRENLAESVEQKTELEAVSRWLEELPPLDRNVFLLRVQYDLSYEEIAAIHGLSLSAAKVKVHRVRLKLIHRRAQQEKP